MRSKTLMGALVAASLMTFGAVSHAATLNPRGDLDHDGIQNRYDKDRDGDGFLNKSDPNPNVFNRTRWVRGHDMDHDGIADRSDRDRDGDGIPNARDPNPNVPNFHRARAYHRAHVAMNGAYGDRDGDGVRNARDRFPNNPRRS